MPLRKFLDSLYLVAGYGAAFFMIGVLAMVLASVVGRLAGFNLRGSDSYAGYVPGWDCPPSHFRFRGQLAPLALLNIHFRN